MGRLKQDHWTDTDGKRHSRIEIVAEHVEFKPNLKRRDRDGKDDEGAAAGDAAPAQPQEEGELKEVANF